MVSCGCAAGVYTSSILVPLCATLLEGFGALDQLANYVSLNGRKFYGYDSADDMKNGSITLRRASKGATARRRQCLQCTCTPSTSRWPTRTQARCRWSPSGQASVSAGRLCVPEPTRIGRISMQHIFGSHLSLVAVMPVGWLGQLVYRATWQMTETPPKRHRNSSRHQHAH